MLKEQDYHVLVACLEELHLKVYKEPGFTEFINYKEKDDPSTIYSISYIDDNYSVSTLFGTQDYATLTEALFVLRQDWNEENWVHGEDEEGPYIELKEGLK